jgi:hypothetical protein
VLSVSTMTVLVLSGEQTVPAASEMLAWQLGNFSISQPESVNLIGAPAGGY